MSNFKYKPGNLITYRERTWVVMPSQDTDILLIKPLGGSEEETTGIFVDFYLSKIEKIDSASFPMPNANDLGQFETAKLLYKATKLSFKNASGPFRSFGKLSFRPRAYQVVPLVMALKQKVTRLLIADDVGVGKTIEALLILRELLERAEIKRFAIICLPHLCDQWQMELKNKLDIDAVIIRSSTVGQLERNSFSDESLFKQFPYQVISIDYIKSEKKKGIFLNDCPEFVIIDEAHSCAKPKGQGVSQQQRYFLAHKLAENPERHLVLLTATPHSGKNEEFSSLIGLLNPDFESYDLAEINQAQRKKIAQHFIQRKRENIRQWMNESTPFPKRDAREIAYWQSPLYIEFYKEALQFARNLHSGTIVNQQDRIRYWAALALLRGIMSSPKAGYEMLRKRIEKRTLFIADNLDDSTENPVIENIADTDDFTRSDLLVQSMLEDEQISRITELSGKILDLCGKKNDFKIAEAIKIVSNWVRDGYNPVVFCRYIETANYVKEEFAKDISFHNVRIEVVTSEKTDQERKEIVDSLPKEARKVLIATDCMSEGINLQDHFSAVLHYDLPWNPNRIEQREGRVDRFGQTKTMVKTFLLWGENNPIDAVVLKVLIRKIKDIHRDTGVSISLGDENKSIMDAVLSAVLENPIQLNKNIGEQLAFDLPVEIQTLDEKITAEIQQAARRDKAIRSIFAHEAIDNTEIENTLKETDEAIGDIDCLQSFTKLAITKTGGTLLKYGNGFRLNTTNMPHSLVDNLIRAKDITITFESPTPPGFQYLGRNSRFVQQLCRLVLNNSVKPANENDRIARSAVIYSKSVSTKTVLIQFRVRNVIEEKRAPNQIISEEMYLYGYQYINGKINDLEEKTSKNILETAASDSIISKERQIEILKEEIEEIDKMQNKFLDITAERTEHLIEANVRFKKIVGAYQYQSVKPVLPPDIIGIYILLPIPKDIL